MPPNQATAAPAKRRPSAGKSSTRYDVEQIKSDVKRINEFIDMVESVGGKMPELTKAVKGLTLAIDTGADLALAAEQTSEALAAYTEDLYKACKNLGDADEEMICQARVDRQWQRRNVEWTLNWRKEDSVIRNFIDNWLKSRMPEIICQRLDWCAGKTK